MRKKWRNQKCRMSRISERNNGQGFIQGLLEIIRDTWSVISSVFEKMKIAEEEIARAKQSFPFEAERIHNAFGILCPPPGLANFNIKLYRAHARELLERFVKDHDLELPTHAELCVYLSKFSLEVPPNQDVACLYSQCFASVFPEEYARIFNGEEPRESYQGAVLALKIKMQRSLRTKRDTETT